MPWLDRVSVVPARRGRSYMTSINLGHKWAESTGDQRTDDAQPEYFPELRTRDNGGDYQSGKCYIGFWYAKL